MAQLGQWVNADGLMVKFGEYYRNPSNFLNRSRKAQTDGVFQEIEFDFDLTKIPTGTVSFTTDLNNDGTLDGFNIGDVAVPAYTAIQQVYIVVNVPAAGGTNIIVGLYQADGTPIDDDGLVTATEGAVANFTPKGAKIVGAGAMTSTTAGTVGPGAHNAYIGLKTNGTYTAGTGRIVVRYMETNTAPANLA